MKKFFLILILMFFSLIALLGRGESSPPKGPTSASHQLVYSNNFFEAQFFSYENHIETKRNEGKIMGVVVPHHLLAYELIVPVFRKIAIEKPATIILIGPNHFNQGSRILTTPWGWQTPFGIVGSDQNLIEDLVNAQLVQVNEEVFQSEHSIGNLMPFLKFYLPETQVVPIILHQDVSWQEAERLGKYLAKFVENEDSLLMASVDFSHYLTRQEAESKDNETIHALRNKNMSRIFTMGNDYLDSPASIGVLFSAMGELDKEFKVLDNTNSGIILNNDLIETTSYFTLIFD